MTRDKKNVIKILACDVTARLSVCPFVGLSLSRVTEGAGDLTG